MVFSLDIGNSKITCLIGTIGQTIEVTGLSTYYYVNTTKSNDFLMIKNGEICNLKAISQKVQQTLNEARINADCSYGGVIINISGQTLFNKYISSDSFTKNGIVTEEIIKKINSFSRNIINTDKYSIIDYEVQEYLLDDNKYVTNPLDLSAQKISSNLNLFFADKHQIKNIENMMKMTNYNLSKTVPSSILSSMSVLNYDEKDLGCCLLDIGAGNTDIVIYENGFIRFLGSIPLAGADITEEISNNLKVSRNIAEELKLKCFSIEKNLTNNLFVYKNDEYIEYVDQRDIKNKISKQDLANIIKKKLEYIFDVIKFNLINKSKYDIIKSGFIITGGTANYPEIEKIAINVFGTSVRIGIPKYNGELSDIISSPRFSTSIGSLYFVKEYLLDNTYSEEYNKNFFTKLKELFKK